MNKCPRCNGTGELSSCPNIGYVIGAVTTIMPPERTQVKHVEEKLVKKIVCPECNGLGEIK